ncbi:hypothetical protein KKG90_09765 [Candidatus Bipolaricaulota bacterium]|nr:hypothetical protein [Candidatus Bipolaricaulota bacterium]
MRCIQWMVVCVFLLMAARAVQAADPVIVPRGSAPVLDGELSPDEWSDAFSISLNSDSTLFLKHAEGFLYLAVQATTMGVPSPLIVRNGIIHVLHASAALGTALYVPEEDAWILSQSFIWQCRARGFSQAALAERNQFLESEGWLGTIGYLGSPNTFEFQILLDEGPLQMLFLFLETTTPLQLLSWPIDPMLALPYTEIITGPIPQRLTFHVEEWATLEFSQP